MTPFLAPSSFVRFLGVDAAVLPFGKLYFYTTETLIEAPVYDADGDELAQPIVGDITGAYEQPYLDDSITYRVRLLTAADVEVFDIDPYPAVSGNQFLPLSFEQFGGGPDASAADNDAAWLLALAALDAGEGGSFEVYDGTYSTSEDLTSPTFFRNLIVKGQGPGRSIIRQTDPNKNVVTLPDGLNINFHIRDLTLQGAGSSTSYSGTGGGVVQNDLPGNDSPDIHLHNVWITNVGGPALSLPQIFNSDFSYVYLYYCGNGFKVAGNSLGFNFCYPLNLPETGAVGYKVTSGSVTITGGNGVNDCDVWAQFGESTVDGDSTNQFCNATLIGSNVEDFNTIGVDLRNGTLRSFATPYLGKAGASNLQAIRARSTSSVGILDNASSFVLKAGASWKNSRAVHALGGNMPFSSVQGGTSPLVFTYYDDAAAGDATMPVDALYTAGTNTYGRLLSNLKVTGQMLSAGTLGFATGAGGTVTQSTDKSTTVALSTSTGNITMNNAALNAGVTVSFTLTNTQIATTDQVLVQHISGGTVGSYTTTAVGGSGSATIYVRNATAGNLSEAIVLKFSVLKAVTS